MTDEILQKIEDEANKSGVAFSASVVKVLVAQIRAEWEDIFTLCQNVSKVYDHITDGLASKPMTDPDIIIHLSDMRLKERVDEALREAINE